MPTPKSKWQIPDLVDLEFFFEQDVGVEDVKKLSQRDREFYNSRLSKNSSPRRNLLRGWLELRRDAYPENMPPLPGSGVGFALRFLPSFFAILGVLAGIFLALGALKYWGDRPINLSATFLLLVALPLFFTILSIALPGWRLLRRGHYTGIFNGWAVGAFLMRLCDLIYSIWEQNPSQSRLAFSASWRNLRNHSELSSQVVSWFAYRLMQSAGLALSLGVFFTVLALGLNKELNFCWETTAKVISPEFVYNAASYIALPWSMLPDSHPTLEQVVGSRCTFTKSPSGLSSADLRSWWQFLFSSILIYAVLPRFLLYGVSLWKEHQALERIFVQDTRVNELINRMKGVQIGIGAGEIGEGTLCTPGSSAEEIPSHYSHLRALVHADLVKNEDLEKWRGELKRQFVDEIEPIHVVNLDGNEDASLLRSISAGKKDQAVLLVLEGRAPCIEATLEYLKTLRQHLGKDRMLIVTLVGLKHNGTIIATPDDDVIYWKKSLNSLADPSLKVQNWKEALNVND